MIKKMGNTTFQGLQKMAQGFQKTSRMPVLFIGHGSPMNAIEENDFVRNFRKVATEIPVPQAILCISAHWYTNGTFVTSMQNPKTIHDFGGFPPELFAVQYPAPGSETLAEETKSLLTETHVELSDAWGLDHGAWSVLVHLYPDANIPVVQLSIDATQPPAFHATLGAQLRALREKGVLILGSGNIVHNLRKVAFHRFEVGFGYDWALEAQELLNRKILSRDVNALANYMQLGTAAQLAIPSPDHFLPLLYILGLMDKKDSLELFNDEVLAGSLTMTSVKIGFEA